jgi:UDPglucose 6-dehydrogenase
MNVVIIGTGYVGLPVGACFADFGNQVHCVDKSAQKVGSINSGHMPIHEPDLQDIVERNIAKKRLIFTTDIASVIPQADVIIIAVGTPTQSNSQHADLTSLYTVGQEIAQHLSSNDGYKVIATKSTVPVGTNEQLATIIHEHNPSIEFDTVSIPEFLREGKAIEDFLHPDRIVIGVETERAKTVLGILYAPFTHQGIPILYCQRKSAEMIKYASNAFLGIKISFINEISDLCETLDADIREVKKGIGLDSRIGSQFLEPGPGFGGSCFPKDMLEIITTSKEMDSTLTIVDTAFQYNSNRSKIMTKKILAVLGDMHQEKKVSILGLSFKAGTDDIRMSPAIAIISTLLEKGISVAAYDPQSSKHFANLFPEIEYTDTPYQAAQGSHALVIITEWDEFKQLDFGMLATIMKEKNIIDLRNILEANHVAAQSFSYHPLGYNIKRSKS